MVPFNNGRLFQYQISKKIKINEENFQPIPITLSSLSVVKILRFLLWKNFKQQLLLVFCPNVLKYILTKHFQELFVYWQVLDRLGNNPTPTIIKYKINPILLKFNWKLVHWSVKFRPTYKATWLYFDALDDKKFIPSLFTMLAKSLGQL